MLTGRDALLARVDELRAAAGGGRVLLGLAGEPGSGKSTVAVLLAEALVARGVPASVVPMDGWHLSGRELARLGRAGRKGAPDTFDAGGLPRPPAAAPPRRRRDRLGPRLPPGDRGGGGRVGRRRPGRAGGRQRRQLPARRRRVVARGRRRLRRGVVRRRPGRRAPPLARRAARAVRQDAGGGARLGDGAGRGATPAWCARPEAAPTTRSTGPPCGPRPPRSALSAVARRLVDHAPPPHHATARRPTTSGATWARPSPGRASRRSASARRRRCRRRSPTSASAPST